MLMAVFLANQRIASKQEHSTIFQSVGYLPNY